MEIAAALDDKPADDVCVDQAARIAAAVRSHMPGLDGLRGVAILLVLLHNLCGLEGKSVTMRLVEATFNFGWVGVQLFFVLSGFLITGILVDSLDRPGYFRGFVTRRTLRIFPLYYVLLLGCFVVAPLVLPARFVPSQKDQIWYWLYLSNWMLLPTEGSSLALPHLWSLAVEEQFYLVWPAVVATARGAKLVALCLGLAALGFAVRLVVRLAHLPPEIVYQNTFARADALALGALGAVLLRQRAWLDWLLPRLAKIGLVAGALFVAMLPLPHALSRKGAWMQTVGYSLLAVIFAVLVVGVAIAPVLRDRPWLRLVERVVSLRPLRWLGKYSYGIYVFHVPLKGVALTLLDGGKVIEEESGIVRLAMVVAFGLVVGGASTLLAVLSWNVLEKRMLAWKDRLAPRPRLAPTGTAV